MLSICVLLLRQFVRLLAEEILRSTPMHVALLYLAITYHIAYNMLSHIYYFNILGEVTFTSQQPDAFTRVHFLLECSPEHLLKWFERSDLHLTQKCFGGHLYLVFFTIRSEKTTSFQNPHFCVPQEKLSIQVFYNMLNISSFNLTLLAIQFYIFRLWNHTINCW